MKQTPLTALHRSTGAKLAEFAGYEMPIQYRGVLSEHQAVRTKSGFFDVSHMGHCRTSDPGISRVLSRPLDKIAIGRGCYLLIMNAEGGIIDDCIAYRLAESEWHIVLNAARKHIDAEILGVELMDDFAMIALQGPEAVSMIGELCPRRGFASDVVALGEPVKIAARTGYTGEDGYEFITAAENAVELWNKILDAGAEPCGLGARDVLRIEAALPLYGSDIDETTDPWETGLGFAVDLERDFIARDALIRRRDSQTRRRAGIVLEKGSVPRHNYEIIDDEPRIIGRVTSGTYSPVLGRGVGLALVDKDRVPSAVRIRGVNCKAEEVRLPFYKAQR